MRGASPLRATIGAIAVITSVGVAPVAQAGTFVGHPTVSVLPAGVTATATAHVDTLAYETCAGDKVTLELDLYLDLAGGDTIWLETGCYLSMTLRLDEVLVVGSHENGAFDVTLVPGWVLLFSTPKTLTTTPLGTVELGGSGWLDPILPWLSTSSTRVVAPGQPGYGVLVAGFVSTSGLVP